MSLSLANKPNVHIYVNIFISVNVVVGDFFRVSCSGKQQRRAESESDGEVMSVPVVDNTP